MYFLNIQTFSTNAQAALKDAVLTGIDTYVLLLQVHYSLAAVASV